MLTIFQNLFSSGPFVPHGHCYLWKTQLVLLNVISDSLIALAYFSIPFSLIYVVRKRKDLPFNSIFFLFGGFIVLCGTGHLMDVWTLWYPTYWLSGSLKALTAAISLVTAVVLVSLIPQILALPSNAQLEEANRKLEKEVIERQQAENKLQQLTLALEDRVKQRTSELTQALQYLQQAQAQLLLNEKMLRQNKEELELRVEERTTALKETLNELQSTQTQLIQTEKMSSLGQMVAGVAHEINNPVSFIRGNLTYAQQYIKDLLKLVQLYQQYYPNPSEEIEEEMKVIDLDFLVPDLTKLLNSMTVGTQRIQEIVKSLRNFSRLDEAELKQVNIHEGIDSTLMILEHRLQATHDRAEIKVIKEYAKLPLVECYPGKLNQVFMNIIANAIDALSEGVGNGEWGVGGVGGVGGEITDSSSSSPSTSSSLLTDSSPSSPPTPYSLLPTPQIHIRTELLDDNWVAITIADNGPGMNEQVRSKLFDPFFTTKPVGKGTGMGLSISYQIIVEKHGGQLSCLSTAEQGAFFAIKIPIQQLLGRNFREL